MTVPNFFVAGMPRAGTTTLWTLLRAHPDIFMPEMKEPRHFDTDLPPDPFARFRRFPLPESALPVCRDRARYLSLFADARGQAAVGEASTYIRSHVAARAIYDFNPRAKFILVLRDPVEALDSLYHLHLRYGSIDCSFDEFFAEYSPWNRSLPAHLNQLQELFGPENVSIHLFEDLQRDTPQVYRTVLQFLGVDSGFSPEFQTHNSAAEVAPGGFPQWLMSVLHSPVAIGLRQRLFAKDLGISEAITRLFSRPRPKLTADQKRLYSGLLQPSVKELEAMTGRDLSGWY